MDTSRYHWLYSWLTDGGRYKADQFQDDLDKLRDYYRNQGYLDIDIPQQKVILDYPSPVRMVVTIQITEGRQYHIGAISFSGNKIYSSRLLRHGAPAKARHGVLATQARQGWETLTLEDCYGRDGWPRDGDLPHAQAPNLATGNIDIEYQIQESTHFLRRIDQDRGQHQRPRAMSSSANSSSGPGEVFDTVRMKISKQRLQNTGFWRATSRPRLESTNIPQRRDLKIAVKEARTGNLTFGAGFSSLRESHVFYRALPVQLRSQ